MKTLILTDTNPEDLDTQIFVALEDYNYDPSEIHFSSAPDAYHGGRMRWSVLLVWRDA